MRRRLKGTEGDLLGGTLDMLILSTLVRGAAHGFLIAQSIGARSRDVLLVEEGSLYPALHRLTRQGFITSSWRVTETNRRARYYALTAAGRRALTEEQATWERLSHAVNLVMKMAPS